MSAAGVSMVSHGAARLDAIAAAAIAEQVWRAGPAPTVLLDLRWTTETTTAALARLILLRARLLRAGRDLMIVGLRGRAEALYEITRLTRILPRVRLPRRVRPRARRPRAGAPAARLRLPGRRTLSPAAVEPAIRTGA